MNRQQQNLGYNAIESYYQYYFSGNQCRICFDGTYVSEIAYIEYSLATNKAPIYSYNDQYFKTIAQGNVLVQGSFHVNLTERNYILRIRDEILGQRAPSIWNDMEFKPFRGRNGVDLTKYLDAAKGDARRDLEAKYMETYWGGPPIKSTYTRPDEWGSGFDIIMMFGVPVGRENTYTIKQVNDVHITGESLVANDSGQGVVEQYSFFAKRIDGEGTTFYSEEASKVEPVDMKNEQIARNGLPIKVTLHSVAWDGGTWHVEFKFSTGHDGVYIKTLSVDKSVLREGSGTSTSNVRPITNTSDSDPTNVYVALDGLGANVNWVELRGVGCEIYDAHTPTSVYTTRSMDASVFSTDNKIIGHQPIRGMHSSLPAPKN